MAVGITATEKPLMKVFDDEYLFEVPFYQRPYAWEEEQTSELLDDLLDAMATDKDAPYFLGSVVLVKEDDKPRSQIVDGQQRLTTLTMLISVLRDLPVRTKLSEELQVFVVQKGVSLKGTEDTYRVALREMDRKFFKDHVQTSGGTNGLLKLDASALPDSQKKIQANVRILHKKLAEQDAETCEALATYISMNCYLVVVATSDVERAFRIFKVMNDRGMDLSPTDILKAEIIGGTGEAYAEKWEGIEAELGRDSFRDLFTHIRMIFRQDKQRGNLQEEFRKYVLNEYRLKDGAPDPAFIDKVLEPYANAYDQTLNAAYGGVGKEKVNVNLRYLSWLDNFDWIPPVMALIKSDLGGIQIASFVESIDRLAYGLFILRADINERIRRYAGVLRAIETGDDLTDHKALDLKDEEKEKIIEIIDGNIYLQTRVCKPLLLRLDSMLADAGAHYDHPIISIEHVLPQRPSDGSQWLDWFPNPYERDEWTHAIANLVLLSRRKNSQASNYEFEQKKGAYFQTGGVAPFALTTEVVNESEWTPAILGQRQEKLLQTLRAYWRLG